MSNGNESLAGEEVAPGTTGAQVDSSWTQVAVALSQLFTGVLGAIGDPCTQTTLLWDRYAEGTKKMNRMLNMAEYVADMNQTRVIGAIGNWGRGYSGATGGRPFETYLVNNFTVWNPIEIRRAIPNGTGNNRPRGINSGLKLGPGIYVKPGGRALQGSVVRRAYDEWLRIMHRDVYSTVIGRIRWQEKLERWVGRSRNDWTYWRRGDPVDPNSELGRNIERFAAVLEEHTRQAGLCETLVTYPSEVAAGTFGQIAGQQDVERQAIAADLEKSRLEDETQQRNVLVLAVAGFMVTLLITRGAR
jgi:hypothetical protein